ncbi:MAG: hypothetical protein GY860_13345 [Desulfobacteraceae bacterium]|nr:hypothetical protein [Desulfobacteraceae bacterium]
MGRARSETTPGISKTKIQGGLEQILDDEKAASLGIRGFLLKPIVMKDLSQKIGEVLERKTDFV